MLVKGSHDSNIRVWAVVPARDLDEETSAAQVAFELFIFVQYVDQHKCDFSCFVNKSMAQQVCRLRRVRRWQTQHMSIVV